ncbi:class IV adenylate cyclase [Peterkaempfera bronchialis]|nr:class IV adenylate cyclase [Peterkaempfera bronchialis]
MSTEVEYEAKILDVDPEKIRAALAEAGAEHHGDRLQRRYVYDIPGKAGTWVRLRDTGTAVTLCVKEISDPEAIDGVRETETTVGDFDATNAILGKLGYQPKAYQENRRSSWSLLGAAIEIDHWPLIPPYLEVEGSSGEHVHETVHAIGLLVEDLTSENTTLVYRRYGIDIASMPRLTFADLGSSGIAEEARDDPSPAGPAAGRTPAGGVHPLPSPWCRARPAQALSHPE